MDDKWIGVIMLYTLKTCEKCKWLKRGLDENGITYNDVNVEDNPKLADIIEDRFKCKTYPMAYIVFTTHISDAWKIWLPESSLLPSTSVAIYNSIPELINELINEIKSTIKK